MNIKLKLKRPKSNKSVIFTEFYKNGIYYRLYTGKTVSTLNWSKKGVVLSGEDHHELINKYLKTWVGEVESIFAEAEINKERINEEIVREKLKMAFRRDIQTELPDTENEIKVTDFTSFMDDFLLAKKNDGKFLQKLEQAKKSVLIAFNLLNGKTLNAYEKLSIKQKSQVDLTADYKLPFNEINLKFLQKFKDHLNKATYSIKENGVFVKKHYTTNYIDKQINGLKQFVNGAIEAKYVEHFTWDSLKSNGNEVDTIHTDFKEIQAMYDVHLTKENEIKIRDKYIINCFLGFRYSDLNQLEPHLFHKSIIGGQEHLVYRGRNQKTDALVEFIVPPAAAVLLAKYEYKIPKYSAKEFNEVIKLVAKQAGLTELVRIRETRAGKTSILDLPKYELICSHTGRRSFCTNYYVEGLPIAIIMSISGHKTEKEFMKYIKKRSVRLEVAAEYISAIKTIDVLRVA